MMQLEEDMEQEEVMELEEDIQWDEEGEVEMNEEGEIRMNEDDVMEIEPYELPHTHPFHDDNKSMALVKLVDEICYTRYINMTHPDWRPEHPTHYSMPIIAFVLDRLTLGRFSNKDQVIDLLVHFIKRHIPYVGLRINKLYPLFYYAYRLDNILLIEEMLIAYDRYNGDFRKVFLYKTPEGDIIYYFPEALYQSYPNIVKKINERCLQQKIVTLSDAKYRYLHHKE
jgi:hypothetical protein